MADQPAWKSKESLVALLEGVLTKDARIQQDVHLPRVDIESTRQCDVVVTTGEPPRQQITIVEVQDRKKKYSAESFDGHLAKLDQVGANHLIVVATSGFAKSVLQKAKRVGPKVRLMLLKELEGGLWPLGIHSDFKRVAFTNVEIHGAHFLESVRPTEGMIPFRDMRFSAGADPVLRTFEDLIDETLVAHSELWHRLGTGSHRRRLHTSTAALGWYLHLDSKKLPFDMVIDGTFDLERHVIPMQAEGYRPADEYGADAWVVTVAGAAGDTEVDFQLILVPEGDDRGYRVLARRTDQTERLRIIWTDEPDGI